MHTVFCISIFESAHGLLHFNTVQRVHTVIHCPADPLLQMAGLNRASHCESSNCCSSGLSHSKHRVWTKGKLAMILILTTVCLPHPTAQNAAKFQAEQGSVPPVQSAQPGIQKRAKSTTLFETAFGGSVDMLDAALELITQAKRLLSIIKLSIFRLQYPML